MNVVSKELVANYLTALQADEAEIQGAAEDYQRARARVDVALLRYTALRDFMTTTLGRSPYAHGIEWPDAGYIDPSTRGRYRFAGMKVGDAIVEVLRDQRNPATGSSADDKLIEGLALGEFWTMSLEQIIEALSEGGLGFPDPVSARAVNAALMRTAGVERLATDGGETRYRLADTDSEPEAASSEIDDLPFE